MSASEKAAETAKEVVVDAAEEVAERAESVAEFARQLNKTKVQFALMGWALGAATGAFVAYKLVQRQLDAKYSEIADNEIAEMREHYREKGKALEAEAAKRPVEEIVRERGYSAPEPEVVPQPMAVPPPVPNLVMAEEDEPEEPKARNIFVEAEITHEWDWHEERKHRSPDIPYVIHYDERHDIEEYSDVTLTYYDGDGVLCNEDDEIVDPDDIDRLLGERNLQRFGHGSNDATIVYIRNDTLQILYEVFKSPNHYAEEVHGFSHDDIYHGNLERMRLRERDEQED